ncbi:MAG: PVC-type heme-binding CxxCH protein, partial [Limisphaerales bacterium]
MNSKIIVQLLAFLSSLITLSAAEPFAEIIRKTEPLTSEEEQKKFHLPPGFEIELVASEPEISKPMNIAFDAKGRLWLTQSREYPFPVLPVEKKGRDEIKILENFSANGRAQKVTTFAGGLNIPLGIYPYKNGAIAFSIPNIYFFQDTDGDGRADQQELLLGRFGYEKDTHGLTSNFRRGYDGWIYADHGFNNDSTLTGKNGHSIKMNSGNCYRFKPDGARVEQFSWGQVNPFGLMFDPLGDLWSADCHSAPVYLLLRGAYYPSFGKPHDGLGFGPAIITHSHGSTAIAGMVFYAAENFPKEFRGNTFIGNVMTCRINRDSYSEHGSTRIAKEEPDFLTSDDPWFRPVDIQLEPDGAIYVADFYNRIIGRYEVP